MTTSLIDADSLLAIDVGTITTRASLFDVVEGRYRFIAAGSAPTTAFAPYNDVSEGVRTALDQLQTITGRTIVGNDETLIVPSRSNGTGVDMIAATLSAGPPLRVVAVGLLEDVSLESVSRLATTTYAQVIEKISLNDRRSIEARIDTILKMRPDVVLVAGGTEGGASHSVMKLLEAIGLASYLLPADQRPEVLYAGNSALEEEIISSFGNIGHLVFAPNVRPSLDREHLVAAQVQLTDIYRSARSRKITGVKELDEWAGGGLYPTASAFGRVIRFLSKVYDKAKGVLGIDVGASATTIASSFSGDLIQGVYPHFGLGAGIARVLDYIDVEDIIRWLHHDIPATYVREYVSNKALYPASLPASAEELDLEQSIAREVIRHAVKETAVGFPKEAQIYGPGLMPWFEPVIATGSILTKAPNLGQSLLMLLDGLQPTGVTTIVLDQNHISPALGAAAPVNPILTVQVLETSTFLNLGTVISPVGEARPGTPVLRVKVAYADKSESTLEVKQGSLEVLQLPFGQTANIHITPLHRFDVGMGGPGRGGGLRVTGGALGIIFDARGRPLNLVDDAAQRRQMINKWRWTLGC